MVIIDGLGDDPIDAFGGRTPFEYARHPNIDKLLKKGSYSEISICGSDFPAESWAVFYGCWAFSRRISA